MKKNVKDTNAGDEAPEKLSEKKRIVQLMIQLGLDPQNSAKKSLGQNFLISGIVIDRIIKATLEMQPKTLIEVGPGLGALTSRVLNAIEDQKLDINYNLIELDQLFSAHWRKTFGGKIFEQDALQMDWSIFKSGPGPAVLMSNLPYQISSSLVIEKTLDQAVTGMVLMFQKEVAIKIKADDRHEDYGMLSIFSQTFWDIQNVIEAAPQDFFPPPKIASRVLSFKAKAHVEVENRKQYLKYIKAAFAQPRKMMISNICHGVQKPREEVEKVYAALGLDVKLRPAQLSVKTHIDFYKKLYGLS